MADILYSTVNDFGMINSTLSAKNFVTKTLSSTRYFLLHDAGDTLEGDSDPAGTYYGVIVIIKTAYDSSLNSSGSGVVAGGVATLAQEDGATGAIELVTAITAPTTSFDACDNVERDYVYAYGGDGVNDFAQIWVDGSKDDETTGALATFPSSLPALTAINAQELVIGTAVYLTEAVTSQAELTALVQGEIDKFNVWGG